MKTCGADKYLCFCKHIKVVMFPNTQLPPPLLHRITRGGLYEVIARISERTRLITSKYHMCTVSKEKNEKKWKLHAPQPFLWFLWTIWGPKCPFLGLLESRTVPHGVLDFFSIFLLRWCIYDIQKRLKRSSPKFQYDGLSRPSIALP